jgi:asparagine synthase (glutamine-hydrolysing)
LFLGFHRLSINDVSEKGNQPFVLDKYPHITVICNGEIYNYKELAKLYEIEMVSKSDCEIIVHLYHLLGIDGCVRQLDGVFGIALYDSHKKKLYCARDPIGVRSMYIGITNHIQDAESDVLIASELKNVHLLCNKIEQCRPGYYGIIDTTDPNHIIFQKYYNYIYCISNQNDESIICAKIRELLTTAVKKRLMSDRKIGCLLSGGLDSSLITALVKQCNPGTQIDTFSIGLEGSPDILYAKQVADYLGTNHHEIIVTEEEMIDALEEDIRVIESYDITTVRASTPMYLLCKYIKQNTDITILFSGEGSDEASGSYMYFHNAPNPVEFQKECVRLLEELHYFDVLRCEKSSAGNGLEIRVPFLDLEFLNYYMTIDPKLKMPRNGMEKYILRKSFDNTLIPSDVLWRSKEGMSDGVSSKTKSWYTIIQEFTDDKYSDLDYKNRIINFPFNTPKTKEALYFREIFNKYYKGRDQTIPHYWMPRWSGDVTDPSARILKVYE